MNTANIEAQFLARTGQTDDAERKAQDPLARDIDELDVDKLLKNAGAAIAGPKCTDARGGKDAPSSSVGVRCDACGREAERYRIPEDGHRAGQHLCEPCYAKHASPCSSSAAVPLVAIGPRGFHVDHRGQPVEWTPPRANPMPPRMVDDEFHDPAIAALTWVIALALGFLCGAIFGAGYGR